MRLIKIAVVFVILWFASSEIARAQSATGGVNGTITDRSDAGISGAIVKLTNVGTKITNQTKTNSSGNFVFINVMPGAYILDVEKSGFKAAHVAVDPVTTPPQK